MGRKRNSGIKDESSNSKRKREVVIKTDSVIELVNRLSSELSKSVASILVNYEGKENMDELIPHLLHSVAVDNNLASQIQQSLGVEVYSSYEDWYNSIDQIESEIYRIHANNNNIDEPGNSSNVPSSSQSFKMASGKERCGTDSGNSSLSSDIFGVAGTDLSYTDMDIDALFMDILSSSNNSLLDSDKAFEGLSDLPALPGSLPPLPLNIMGQTFEIKPFVGVDGADCNHVVTSDVLSTKEPLDAAAAADKLHHESAKLPLDSDSVVAVNGGNSSKTSPPSFSSQEEVKSDCSVTLSNNVSVPENVKKLPKCTIDITKVNNPLAVVRESSASKECATETVNTVQNCDKIDDLNIDYHDSNDAAKSLTNLESEQISSLLQNRTKAKDCITEKSTVKLVKPSPPKTRSRSKIVSTEEEILQLIEMVDSDAENKTTEENGENDELKSTEPAEQENNNSDVWQPSVVLERIDSSKLAQKKTKKVTPQQVRRCIANMKNYVKMEKPDMAQINDAMEVTFSWRRKMVTDPAISIHAVLKEFPALSLFEVVKCECDRLLGDKLKTLENLLEENFVRAANSRKIKSPHKLFLDGRKAFKKSTSDEMKKISGMVCLAFYLAEKQAVGSLFQLQTKKKKVVSKLIPMMILEEDDLFTENREIRIFADGTEMLKVPNFYEGVLTIYSLYYVLDIVYDKNVTLLFQYFDFLIGLPQSSFSTQPE